MLKILRFLLLFLLAAVATTLSVFYFTCPVYRFADPQPFRGDSIYNPYKNRGTARWLAGNFQVQSRVWMGITNGRKNTPEAIWKEYRRMGYDIIAISDYQSINRAFEDSAGYLPVYEHGYGIHKTHQVCIGSRNVLWRDYPLGAGLSQKQHIIDLLLKDNELIALAHPDLRNGYRVEELRYLTGYHLMEVLNGARLSMAHWDTALSAGYPAFILADDDAHDIFKPGETGEYVTMIAGSSLRPEEIIEQLKAGNAYGVRVLSLARSNGFIHRLPVLLSCTQKEDTLRVSFSDTAREIRFIGQHGRILAITRNLSQGQIPFTSSDTYIRVEAEFEGKAVLFLNPVFRFQGGKLQLPQRAFVDHRATLRLRLVVFAGVVLLVWGFVFFRKKTKLHGRS
jgi:hypothetical protein